MYVGGAHVGTCVHTHIHAQVHTHKCIHTRIVHTKDTHTHAPTYVHTGVCAHTYTLRCIRMCRYTQTHALTRVKHMISQLKPQEHSQEGRLSTIQLISLPFSEKSLKTSRITLSDPRWMGGAPQEPQEIVSTLQGFAIL